MTDSERELRARVAAAEKNIARVKKGAYRCKYHLLPPVGWLNDPNGLIKVNGLYHVFFQYAPESAEGEGLRGWGHYVSPDLVNWEYRGMAIYPDTPFDADGAYSGSCVADKDGFRIYYTGNVKHKDKNYDYVSDGRESNTILIRTEDGFNLDEKQVLLRTPDYPEEFTRHIRDPKVNITEEGYSMVLGGRLKGDKGAVLLYKSRDGFNFTLDKVVSTPDKFGFMWECPDRFTLDGLNVLSVSPQGVPHEKYAFQNIYASGCFIGDVKRENFREWDFGFDFYAPQTFWDGQRRILFGWAGMPDADYDNLPEVREGWQHSLTLPRVLTAKNGVIYQSPAEEVEKLRQREIPIDEDCACYELQITDISQGLKVILSDALEISFGKDECVCSFVSAAGRGRKTRRAAFSAEKAVIFMDVSVCEVYFNDGEKVFTTKLFPDSYSVKIYGNCKAKRFALGAYSVKITASEF